MSRTQISWALGVVAPWCIGAGLLVSFTAEAGQDFAVGATLAPIESRAASFPEDLIPRMPALSGDLTPRGTGRGILREARLAIGAPEEFHRAADEISPHVAMKPNARHLPLVDRAHKGDPAIGLRPSFDAHLRNGGYKSFMGADLLFHNDESTPASAFAPIDGDLAGPDSVASFEPWAEGESPATTQPSPSASSSPGQGASVMTVRPAALSARLKQGASPVVPRATALASTTPAPADATPIEVVALPGGMAPREPMQQAAAPKAAMPQSAPQTLASLPGKPAETSAVARAPDQPDYAALVDPGHEDRERKCLAEAVYFEARSEPEEGQAAVAQVVLNRVSSGLYPSNVCGVVYQNRNRYKACQFSFACEGKSLRITDQDSWQTALRVANEVMDGKTYVSDVGGATHYHANYVRPRWARRLKKMDRIGHHIFYALKPGQT